MQEFTSNRILVIDDNPAIHEDFRKILIFRHDTSELDAAEAILFDQDTPAMERTDFEIDSAYQGQEGLGMVQRAVDEGRPYALVFVDIRMPPGWDGIETLEKLWEVDAHLQAVVCSAYSDYTWEDITARLGQSDKLVILKKPFDTIEVVQLAHALTTKWRLAHELKLKFKENERLMSTFFDNSSEAIVISDSEGKGLAVNPAFTRLTGYTLSDLQDKSTALDPELLANTLSRNIWKDVGRADNWQGELALRNKNMDAFPTWTHHNAVRDEQGSVVNYLTLFSDITRVKDQQKQLEYMANYDSLTGLPNRTLFYDRLKHANDRAKQSNSRYAVAFIDTDNFKYVNDTLGHAGGDQLLRSVAERLKTTLREDDMVCRYADDNKAGKATENMLCRFGGDEFALLLEGIADIESVQRIMQRIVATFRPGFYIEGRQIFTTASIGVAVYPDDGDDIETLLKNSDTAMYKAKEAGKDTYQFFTTSMNREATERLFLETRLRHALDHGKFYLTYQPQVDLESGAIIGVESLIRCRDPELAFFSASQLIRVAELSGLILSIGKWAIEEACRDMQQWRRNGLNIKVSVNLSARQFQQKNLAATIAESITNAGLNPECLELELTESAVMQDPERANQILLELKTMGVSLAIDDFGTGYSSLTYLKRFPVDKLKIDQAFVRDITTDEDDASIVKAVISLAHSLGVKVVAEGVETKEQLSYLRANGCDHAQGYYFSKPVVAADLVVLLSERAKLARQS